jgi:type IV pilus assembly protein PilV
MIARQARLKARRQRGATMFEVLISLLVMTIGILGVAAMQALSLSGSHTAAMRSQAIALSLDLADRMRANRIAVRATGANSYDGVVPVRNDCRATYINAVVAVPAVCTPTEIAADDIFDWTDRVGRMLPQGTGDVCVDSTPDDGVSGAPACDGVGNAYAVKVFWNEKAYRSAAIEARRFVTVVQP